MRNRRHLTPHDLEQVEKLTIISGKINRLQKMKMGLSAFLILPVVILMLGDFNVVPIEMAFGYILTLLLALQYLVFRDWKLSVRHAHLKEQLNARVAVKKKRKPFMHTIQNSGSFSGYAGELPALG